MALARQPPGSQAGCSCRSSICTPRLGDLFNLKSFLIVVMGGMGSIEGAAAAGVVLGVVENLTSLYWGNEWALVVDFVIFILVLSLKPSGIFGSQRA